MAYQSGWLPTRIKVNPAVKDTLWLLLMPVNSLHGEGLNGNPSREAMAQAQVKSCVGEEFFSHIRDSNQRRLAPDICNLLRNLFPVLWLITLSNLNTQTWHIHTGEGKTNITCLSKVLGHHVPPDQLHCALALILQVPGSLLEGWTPFFIKIFPHFVFSANTLNPLLMQWQCFYKLSDLFIMKYEFRILIF